MKSAQQTRERGGQRLKKKKTIRSSVGGDAKKLKEEDREAAHRKGRSSGRPFGQWGPDRRQCRSEAKNSKGNARAVKTGGISRKEVRSAYPKKERILRKGIREKNLRVVLMENRQAHRKTRVNLT